MDGAQSRLRNRAHYAVNKAVRKGLLQRPCFCELCNDAPPIAHGWRHGMVAHHAYGYDHPLKVWWICRSCNSLLRADLFHCERVTLAEARAYITQMATGKAKRVDLSTVDRLLDFLGTKTGDTLTLDDLLKRYPAQL